MSEEKDTGVTVDSTDGDFLDAPPSIQWQHAAYLPDTDEASLIAERLVLLAHYGADFTVWGGARRVRYWDALLERVKASTYTGPTLSDWWTGMTRSLPTSPRTKHEREDVANLIAYPDGRAVLRVLRNNTEVLVLRVRVISEYRKIAWNERQEALRDETETMEELGSEESE